MLGSRISHYQITGKLGTGGMGVVYEAEDTRLRRKVALKFLPDELADDPDAVRRFRREADTIATLSHGNICIIYDIDEHDGRVFIAMECVEGVNLKTYVSRHTLTTSQIADYPSISSLAGPIRGLLKFNIPMREYASFPLPPGRRNRCQSTKSSNTCLSLLNKWRFLPIETTSHTTSSTHIIGFPELLRTSLDASGTLHSRSCFTPPPT